MCEFTDPTISKNISTEEALMLIKMADDQIVEGWSMTQEEWAKMPEAYIGHCNEGCYSPQLLIKGSIWEYGARGIYICTGCHYAYAAWSNPDPIEEDVNSG